MPFKTKLIAQLFRMRGFDVSLRVLNQTLTDAAKPWLGVTETPTVRTLRALPINAMTGTKPNGLVQTNNDTFIVLHRVGIDPPKITDNLDYMGKKRGINQVIPYPSQQNPSFYQVILSG